MRSEPTTACEFYRALLGWKLDALDRGKGPSGQVLMELMEPMEVEGVGRMAVIQGPLVAALGVMAYDGRGPKGTG